MRTAPPSRAVIGIAGWKKSGKTTLVVRLIEEFTRAGIRVATLKHAHHNFRVDDAETDSARHRRAGAHQVAIVSNQRWALMTELRGEPEPDLEAVLARLDPCDLVIVEGYKWAPIPKIEARRRDALGHAPLSACDPHVIAIATDEVVDGEVLPVFSLDDIAGIARFIAGVLGLSLKPSPGA